MQYDEFTVFRRKSQKLIDIYTGIYNLSPAVLYLYILFNYDLIFMIIHAVKLR